MSVLLSAAIGFALAAGAAYLLEYLDDTLKTPEEITRVLGVPVIGFIAETGLGRDEQDGVYVSKHPRSPIAEAYRSLRANLEFAAVDRPLSTILIASADPESGKSSVAANLAVVIAQGDKKPILMDADLRKPSIHNFTGLPNENGLSDLFRSKAWASACLKYWQEGRITVITGGKPPPNPAELLGSRKMDEVLSTLGESADVVVIDSPPFVVSDALMLAAKVDGVLLVVRPGHTRRKTSRAMMEQLNRTEARILGVVLNRIPRRGAEYYGGYLYHSLYGSDGYYTSDDNAQAKEAAKEKGDGWRSKIGLSKYLQSINRKPLTAKYQDKNRPAVQNRDETPESTSADLEGEEQEVPDISNDED
jgi:capsular exopolysaccharide synthesis family protein